MGAFFSPVTINGLTLPNRSVRSATWEGMADDEGRVTPRLVDTMVRLARNQVGLIITGHTYVHPLGKAGPWQMGIYSDDMLHGLRQMADAVHDAGGRICLQLAHAGGHAATRLTNHQAIGPSSFEGRLGGMCRTMSAEDIQIVIDAMAGAARRAQVAGFDAVQIHAAHGYLLSQFLSPATNHRQDDYGGSLINRARLVCDVIRAVRQAVGTGFPILIKINSEDFVETGFNQDDMLQVAPLLVEAGVDAVEMSGGTVSNPQETHCARTVHPTCPEEEVYYRPAAQAFKKSAVGLPLILVGGIRSWEMAEQLLVDGTADLIAFGRPLISEPGLIRRWQTDNRNVSACISCNRCYVPLQAGQGVSCVVASERHQRKPR
jgi:2,4-dienoyl-CoA reductase-like NADH-dependent reductase (Old Yellow Enzyme family)